MACSQQLTSGLSVIRSQSAATQNRIFGKPIKA
jgi:hypothetical protein